MSQNDYCPCDPIFIISRFYKITIQTITVYIVLLRLWSESGDMFMPEWSLVSTEERPLRDENHNFLAVLEFPQTVVLILSISRQSLDSFRTRHGSIQCCPWPVCEQYVNGLQTILRLSVTVCISFATCSGRLVSSSCSITEQFLGNIWPRCKELHTWLSVCALVDDCSHLFMSILNIRRISGGVLKVKCSTDG